MRDEMKANIGHQWQPEIVQRIKSGDVFISPDIASDGTQQTARIGILLGLTLVFGVSSIFIFRRCDRAARERGMIEMVTNY